MKNYLDLATRTEHEKNAIENGHRPLSGTEIKEWLVGKQFLGGYLHGFQHYFDLS